MSRLDKAENNMDKWYGLALGQCIEELQAEVKGLDDYEAKSEESGVIWLFCVLQAVTSRIDLKSDVIFIEQEMLLIVITMRQVQSESKNK